MGGGTSGLGLPGGLSSGGSVGCPGVAGGISGGSIGITSPNVLAARGDNDEAGAKFPAVAPMKRISSVAPVKRERSLRWRLTDRLNVVAVGIEHEGAVIVRV